MPSLGFLFGLALSPLFYFAVFIGLVALLAKAFSFGTGAPLHAVCIAMTVMLSGWHLRLPLRDAVRIHKGLPRKGYPALYRRAFRKALVGCAVMYLVYLAAARFPN